MSRRTRRRATNELVVIHWRDIPAQVNARRDGDKAQWVLPERFQHAIDRAAGVAGLTDTASYVAQWRQTVSELPDGDDLQGIATDQARRLDADYPKARLEAIVAAGGVDAAGDSVGGGPGTDTEEVP